MSWQCDKICKNELLEKFPNATNTLLEQVWSSHQQIKYFTFAPNNASFVLKFATLRRLNEIGTFL